MSIRGLASATIKSYCITYVAKVQNDEFRRRVTIRQRFPPTSWHAFTVARNDFLQFARNMGSIEYVRVVTVTYGPCDPVPSPPIAPISPDALAGIEWWLKADAQVYVDGGVTLATNGQTVQQWNDFSGGGKNAVQTDANFRPTFVTNVINGLPVVRFTPANPFSKLMEAIVGVENPFSALAVVSFVSGGTVLGTNSLFVGGFSSVSMGRNPSSGSARLYNGNLQSGVEGGVIPTSTFVLLSAICNGTTSVVRLNGAEVASGNIGAFVNAQGMLGGANFGDAATLSGDIAELAYYDRAVSISELEAVELYLRNKWGL